jgi:hypothetical protein
VVDRGAAAEDEVLGRDVGDELAVPVDADAAVVGDLPDGRGVEVPLLEDGLDLALAARSPTSSIRSWLSESMISYGVIPVSRTGTRSMWSTIPPPPSRSSRWRSR